MKTPNNFEETDKKCKVCGGEYLARGFCKKHYADDWYSRNRAEVVKKRREYYLANIEKIKARSKYSYYPKNRDRLLAKSAIRSRSIQGRARQAVHYAIKKGEMVRQACEQCGKFPTEAHHHKGYERENWLDVVWLCSQCHGVQHRKVAV